MFRPLPTLTMPPCAVHVRLLMAVLSGLLITCGAALFATACSAPGYAYIRSPAVGVARATAVPALQRTVPALRRLVAREFLGPAVHLPRPAPLPHDSLSSALPKAKALALVGFALAVFAAVATGLRWGLCSAEGAGLGQTLALCAASGRKKKKSKPKKLGRTRRRPKAVVFDLDACIWMPDTWDCSGAPFRKTGPTSCQCSGGEMMRLLPSARNTIHMLKTDPEWSGTRIAVASCCCWPHWAEELFDLFELSPDMKLKEVRKTFRGAL